MSGGDGAPGWTFEAVGLDFTRFGPAGAAHVMQYAFDYNDPKPHQRAYPPMSWGINYRLPANGIMWTLFWGGSLFTPECRIEGRNIQHFLQQHYLGAMAQVARHICHLPNVLGFDTLNEPGVGWLEHRLSYRHMGPSAEEPARARPGPALSPLDALAAASGIPTRVPWLRLNTETFELQSDEERVINQDAVRIWRPDVECPFERAGSYIRKGQRVHARDDSFFKLHNGQEISIAEDAYAPFFASVARTIREVRPDWLLFAELDPYGATGRRTFPRRIPERTVNACHWYDAALLYLQRFDPENAFDWRTKQYSRAPDEIRHRYVNELAQVAARGRNTERDMPALIGEFGIPYNLNEAGAYRLWAEGHRSPDIWSPHTSALALMYEALDELLLSSTQWNYTASNRNDPRVGDGWNQEDLSIFSPDQYTQDGDPDSGGRAVTGFCRPYVRRAQGILRRFTFDRGVGTCEAQIAADHSIAAETEVYVPKAHYPAGFKVEVDLGADVIEDSDMQLVRIRATRSGTLHLRIIRVNRD